MGWSGAAGDVEVPRLTADLCGFPSFEQFFDRIEVRLDLFPGDSSEDWLGQFEEARWLAD